MGSELPRRRPRAVSGAGLEGAAAPVRESFIALNGGRPTALLTGTANADVARRARVAGARGFLTKSLSPDRLLHGVARLVAGETVFETDAATPAGDGAPVDPLQGALHLTPRELDVLRGLCDGKANKEIARDLDVQEVTVKLHVKTLSRKLQARNRTHAAMLAKEMRLV
jgi:DNA-binding NarL/FixJ family response regulator